MINLLPPIIKEHYLYARRNTKLRRWLVASLFGLLGLVVITSFGVFDMQHSINSTSAQVATLQQQLKDQKQAETEKQVQDISSNLKLVVQVLSREVLFSQLLKQIATALPSGANLTGLSISKVQGAIDLTANATDYNTGTQVQVNLQDPRNKIFSKADLVNLSCNGGSSADPSHPCQVTIRALFSPNNPYLFINSAGAKP
jgi:Tfp pilus assembly protein PilN